MITLDWTEQNDRLLHEAISKGRVAGELHGAPTEITESGLAHIFFYGDTVYKLYKTHADKDHFIKGVLAPTNRRTAFIEHDFALNKHFSGEVYKTLHSVYLEGEIAVVGPYDGSSIYTMAQMSRLDFDTNLHGSLLSGDINDDELELLGYQTAQSIDTYTVTVPDEVNWYDLAKERVGFLSQFIDWLPTEFASPLSEARVIEALEKHLEKHAEEYRQLKGGALSVNIDNHDENIFFIAGKPQTIDVLPPMSCWWYGPAHANLSNIMVNIETLHSLEAAQSVQTGYCKYFAIDSLPTPSFGFTHAFAQLISIAHFGSVPEKRAVTERYMQRVPEIASWL
jgi:aminoglycoside phosphotransferase family enzyme